MMNLMMVTYELDYTQFLVNAETREEAVQKAIHANCNKDLMGDFDDEEQMTDAKDERNYTVADIEDMENLYYILLRNDIIGLDNYETIIYMD